MRILVTGATGFIGGHLCRLLGEGGGGIVAATRNGDCPEGAEPRRIGDLGPETEWREALAGVEAVVHLAGRAHVMRDSSLDPLAAFRRANVGGTRSLAAQAAEAGVRRMVYVSSITIHGGESRPARPLRADDAPAPRDPYAISKLEAEQALAEISERTGLERVVIRPPLVYGPGVKGNLLSLLRVCHRGVPLPLGSVDNRRSLVGVRNLAVGIAACLRHPAAAGQTFLIRDGEDVSTPELVRRLCRCLGRRSRLLPLPLPVLRVAGRITGRSRAVDRLLGSLQVDDAPLRQGLAWRPPFSLDEGLAEMADWFRAAR